VNPAPQRHYVALDAFRFIAALGIVLHHCAIYADAMGWQSHVTMFDNFRLCVDFFFALSGFVLMHVHGSAITSGSDYLRFLQKRLARIYPLHADGDRLHHACACRCRQADGDAHCAGARSSHRAAQSDAVAFVWRYADAVAGLSIVVDLGRMVPLSPVSDARCLRPPHRAARRDICRDRICHGAGTYTRRA
jgi:hypothetical protein